MRRPVARALLIAVLFQGLLVSAPAQAAPVNINDYRSAAVKDLDELYEYITSNEQWEESVIRGKSSPQGTLSYLDLMLDDDVDQMAPSYFDQTQPGDSLPARSTITYWYQACTYLKYLVSSDAQWDTSLDAWGAINIRARDAFKDYIALEDARIKKDPNWDSRHAWYLGSNSEKEPGFFLARLFAMTMGYVKLYDRDSFVVGTDGLVYGPNNPCLAAAGDAAVLFYKNNGFNLGERTVPWGRGPLSASVREQGKEDAFSGVLPTDSLCWYSLNAEQRAAGGTEFACQPAIRTTYVGSPSGSGDLNFIAYMKSFANTLVEAQKYWREELAKLQGEPVPTGSNPIKGNTGSSIISLTLPLSNVSVEGVIGRVIRTIVGVLGAVALLMFIWGGITWMTAAGSQEQVGKAKKTIVWAALGLIAIFGSYAVLNLVIQTFS